MFNYWVVLYVHGCFGLAGIMRLASNLWMVIDESLAAKFLGG